MFRFLAMPFLLLLCRWSFQMATPQHDLRTLLAWGRELLDVLQRKYTMLRIWLIGLISYVPSASMRAAWESLRDRVQAGQFGVEGT